MIRGTLYVIHRVLQASSVHQVAVQNRRRYFLKKQNKMPYYDQFVGKYLKVKNPAFYMGAAGVVGVLLQVIFFAFCGVSESMMGMTMKMSVGIPWLNWVAFAIYAIVGAMGILVFNNED